MVEFSFFLQDLVTPEDEETTPEEPWVVETTFGVGGWIRRSHGLRVFGLVGKLCR